MANSLIDDLIITDLLPLVNMVAKNLPQRSRVDTIVSDSRLDHVRYPMGRADETQVWRAVFEAALDAPPETLESLLHNIEDALGSRLHSDLEEKLGLVGCRCVSRIAQDAHPDVGDQVEALLNAAEVPEMETAAKVLRNTAIRFRRLLMRPVLADAYIKLAPNVLDPERRRMELADLAIDVVTAVDYLLSLLGASATKSPPLLLERELGSDHGRGPVDEEALFRLIQRRFDARAVVVRAATRLMEGLRRDVANR